MMGVSFQIYENRLLKLSGKSGLANAVASIDKNLQGFSWRSLVGESPLKEKGAVSNAICA
jgi:hypothetical protein